MQYLSSIELIKCFYEKSIKWIISLHCIELENTSVFECCNFNKKRLKYFGRITRIPVYKTLIWYTTE